MNIKDFNQVENIFNTDEQLQLTSRLSRLNENILNAKKANINNTKENVNPNKVKNQGKQLFPEGYETFSPEKYDEEKKREKFEKFNESAKNSNLKNQFSIKDYSEYKKQIDDAKHQGKYAKWLKSKIANLMQDLNDKNAGYKLDDIINLCTKAKEFGLINEATRSSIISAYSKDSRGNGLNIVLGQLKQILNSLNLEMEKTNKNIGNINNANPEHYKRYTQEQQIVEEEKKQQQTTKVIQGNQKSPNLSQISIASSYQNMYKRDSSLNSEKSTTLPSLETSRSNSIVNNAPSQQVRSKTEPLNNNWVNNFHNVVVTKQTKQQSDGLNLDGKLSLNGQGLTDRNQSQKRGFEKNLQQSRLKTSYKSI
ncbi:hypothetical protein [Candidatus Deianiraea vastatrix]|uniref:Uncharacterized protein n=1 Tax=Candidatus Deianiraea vastatrix TaxID=2163644 RepID=A0A5B8XCI1_9RICK|nr:hypothetical protein [Candidatus Deianiraea vastatrix]QED23059.1 hypothetical protein Deia_00251 [Candidatus Deianiraea vastatrix]